MLFDPHNNHQLYEGHIPEATLSYNQTSNTFHRRHLLESTSMVMSPVDILKPDYSVNITICIYISHQCGLFCIDPEKFLKVLGVSSKGQFCLCGGGDPRLILLFSNPLSRSVHALILNAKLNSCFLLRSLDRGYFNIY